MRTLKSSELNLVAGGDGSDKKDNGSAARTAAIKQCEGLPDETKVTFEIEISSNVGGKVGGIGGEATTTQTVKVETTCGALRKAG